MHGLFHAYFTRLLACVLLDDGRLFLFSVVTSNPSTHTYNKTLKTMQKRDDGISSTLLPNE